MVQASVVLTQRMGPDAAAADALGVPAGEPLFQLERVRLADGTPLAHDRVWLPGGLAAPLLEADFTRSGLYDELAARCGIRLTGGRERISAVVPDGRDRSLLSVPEGVACLSVERRGCVGPNVVEHRITVVRGDRWSVIADWSARGYALGANAFPSRTPVAASRGLRTR
jgi:GntR family transcriptional regulator